MAPVKGLYGYINKGRLESFFTVENISVLYLIFGWMVICITIFIMGGLLLCYIRNYYSEITVGDLGMVAVKNEPARYEFQMDDNNKRLEIRPVPLSPPITDPIERQKVKDHIIDILQ